MLTGQCECGAVRYRVEDAFLYSMNCHCSRCRAATGSAFKAFAGIEREKLELTDGADRLLVHGADDLNDTRCAVCGSLLFSVVREGAYVHVALGSLVDPRASGRRSTSSSARRRRGSRSRTTCLSSTSSSRSCGTRPRIVTTSVPGVARSAVRLVAPGSRPRSRRRGSRATLGLRVVQDDISWAGTSLDAHRPPSPHPPSGRVTP